MNNNDIIQSRILSDMSEGVFVVGFDGRINFINKAAQVIFKKASEDILGLSFASVFFEYEENDAFNQAIMNAIYERASGLDEVVSFFNGEETRQLHMTTSFLTSNGENVGIVCVFFDITELAELRDALVAMQRIQEMNQRLQIRNELLARTFGRFLSDDIVRQLIDTPDGLNMGGSKQSITVLMSDIRGFTAFSETMKPTDLIEMLNNYLATMTDVIQKYHGTIIEFIGDGILAIFGAPVFSDSHASDAVAAAIEMQYSMDRINQWNHDKNYPELRMGIGINTGEVIVGNIGSEKRTKYGVLGSHVNLAGRIESYTTTKQILISPSTREQIKTALTVESELTVHPKGVLNEIVLTQVTGIGAPYDISYTYEHLKPVPLHDPQSVQLLHISGKHVDGIPQNAVITALCSTGAVLRTTKALDIFENISLDIGAPLYAKVTEINGQDITVIFTSYPVSFDRWLENITK